MGQMIALTAAAAQAQARTLAFLERSLHRA